MSAVNPLSNHLRLQVPLILDGGLATELEFAGYDLDHPLWSARILAERPEAIAEQHRRFLEAGADVITAAVYQATFPGLMAGGFSRVEAAELMTRAVEIACRVRDQFDHTAEPGRLRPLVAAGMGPYGAYLADGSEYRGNYGLSRAELYDFHAERFHLLAQTPADLLAWETVPSLPEAEALAALAGESGPSRTWLSFSCRDEAHISDGTPLTECARLVEESPGIAALGINCTAPRLIASLIREARKAGLSKPLIVYPNSGEQFDPLGKSWHGTATTAGFVRQAREWLELGASVIGGCCRVRPEHVRELREALVRRG